VEKSVNFNLFFVGSASEGIAASFAFRGIALSGLRY
jgi:hypothetical protein